MRSKLLCGAKIGCALFMLEAAAIVFLIAFSLLYACSLLHNDMFRGHTIR